MSAKRLPSPSSASRRFEQRWIALGVVCLGQLMMILDGSIVNIALPRIQSDLRFTSTSLTWVPNAYLIAFGSFLLLGGRLGDLLGRSRMFFAGMGLFTLASAACGIAESSAVLIAARFIQGLGAAIAAPAILALIHIEFPDPIERTRTMGFYTFVSVAGGSIGLLLGGVLTQTLSWHWIFFINVPIGLLAVMVGWRVLPRDPGRGLRDGLDLLGSILVTTGAMLGIYAVVTSESHGVLAAGTLVPFIAAIALLLAFFLLEARLENPILPPRLLRQRTLIVSCVVRAAMVVGMFATFYLCSLYFERVRGFDPISAGLAFLPQTLIVAALSLGVTAWLVKRFGNLPVMFTGMGLVALSPVVLALTLRANSPYVPGILSSFLLLGVGGGMSFMTLMGVALSNVEEADAGIASGLINVSLQIGSAIGVAVLGTVAAARSNALQHQGALPHAALAGGFRLAFWVLTLAVAVGLAVGVRYLWAVPRRATRATTAEASEVAHPNRATS